MVKSMKSNSGPWTGQVKRLYEFWECRAYNEETSKSFRGDCDSGFHETLFWAQRCAKRKARKLNSKKEKKVHPDGWFNA